MHPWPETSGHCTWASAGHRSPSDLTSQNLPFQSDAHKVIESFQAVQEGSGLPRELVNTTNMLVDGIDGPWKVIVLESAHFENQLEKYSAALIGFLNSQVLVLELLIVDFDFPHKLGFTKYVIFGQRK